MNSSSSLWQTLNPWRFKLNATSHQLFMQVHNINVNSNSEADCLLPQSRWILTNILLKTQRQSGLDAKQHNAKQTMNDSQASDSGAVAAEAAREVQDERAVAMKREMLERGKTAVIILVKYKQHYHSVEKLCYKEKSCIQRITCNSSSMLLSTTACNTDQTVFPLNTYCPNINSH